MWTREEFQAWKRDPKTAGFLRHLTEVREILKENWAQADSPASEPDRAMAITYGDIVGLEYERDIAPFYIVPGLLKATNEEEDDDGA